jgi:cytochrome P450
MYKSTSAFVGTDTTAVALCNVFYYLLTNHGALDQLRKELDENISHSIEQPDVAVLNKLPFLQAVTYVNW